MGPEPSFHNPRGYLTETIFDVERGAFVERPFPARSATPRHSSSANAMKTVRTHVERRLRAAHTDHPATPTT